MHRGHDHDHHHHGNGSSAGLGHNHAHHPKPVAQWQTPHRHGEDDHHHHDHAEPDLDKVEAAFVEAFMEASDPTSFLRLTHIPFEMNAADGAALKLLRVEVNAMADVASLTPHLGGTSFRYDPLPANLVSHRRRLQFIYFDGATLRSLSFVDVRSAMGTGG
jgi:hypothetical protein